MCDICQFEGLDYRTINFPKKNLIKRALYTVSKTGKLLITLCYIHDIELFVLGERRFFLKYQKSHLVLTKNSERFKTDDLLDDSDPFK